MYLGQRVECWFQTGQEGPNHVKEHCLYAEDHGESLKGFKKESELTRFTFKNDLFDCNMEGHLERR